MERRGRGEGTLGYPLACTPTQVQTCLVPMGQHALGAVAPPSPLVPQCKLGGAALPWTHPCGPDLSPWAPPGLDSEPRLAPAPQGCREPLSTLPACSRTPTFEAQATPMLRAGGDLWRLILFEEWLLGREGSLAPLTSIPTCMMFWQVQ